MTGRNLFMPMAAGALSMRKKRLLSLVATAAILVLLPGCGSWVISIFYSPATGLTISLVKTFREATGPVTDRPIGAVVVPNGATLSGAEFRVNGSPVAIDQDVSADHQAKLQTRLECAGLFDSGTEHLEFFQTTGTVTTDFTDDLEFSVQPEPCFGTIAVAGSSEDVLDACAPEVGCDGLCDIVTHQESVVCGKIPTMSEWGLMAMVLLVLTVGTVVFTRRRRPATA